MAISNFISNVKSLWVGTGDYYISQMMPNIIGVNGSFNIENSDQISTVYTCLKILAETISRMPLNVYSDKGEGRTVDKEDYRYPILHYNPNGWTSQQTFFAALEYWRNLRGNSFARIWREEDGRVNSLELINPLTVVDYNIIEGELYYKIQVSKDKEEIVNSSEILHFRGQTKDGIWGLSPIEALRMNLGASYQGLQAIEKFYQNGTMSPKAIKSTVGGANHKAMIDSMTEFNTKYAGTSNSGKMIQLPPNTEIQDLALNFADQLLIGTLKFNAGQIAALYGVPPEMVGLYESSKYNNVEQMALSFKTNTIASIARTYRQELEHKLLTRKERLNNVSIEFNTMSLIELDATTRTNYFKSMQGMGAMTPNDICRLEGLPTYEAGDIRVMPGNYLPVEKIATNASNNFPKKVEL